MSASIGDGSRTSCSRTLMVAFELASMVHVIASACGAVVATAVADGLAVGATVATEVEGDGDAAPPHAGLRTSKSATTRLGTGTFTNTHDSRHLRMHAAVVCEHTHLIECEGGALVRVCPDIERSSRVIRRDRVELLASIHERDRRASCNTQLLRCVGPVRLRARGLDDLDLVRARRRCRARATA